MERRLIFGTASFVTGAFGLTCASVVVRALATGGQLGGRRSWRQIRLQLEAVLVAVDRRIRARRARGEQRRFDVGDGDAVQRRNLHVQAI